MSKRKGRGSAGISSWESALQSTAFEDDEWKASVVWIVPNLTESTDLDALVDAVQTGTRKRFTTITKEDIFKDVEELGNPKNRKIKEVPAFVEICESVKAILDTGEPIPVPLLAKLIKFKLLWLKSINQQKKEHKQEVDVKGSAKDKSRKSKSAGGKKGDKKTPEPLMKKETKLKKRGEEDEESKYINDEPLDGPDIYVLISGFYDAGIISSVVDVGVKISAVIRFQVEKDCADEDELISKFWSDLGGILQQASDSSFLQELAVLTCKASVDHNDRGEDNTDERKALGASLFDTVAEQLYELLTWKQQYINYKSHTQVIHVPVIARDESSSDVDMSYYQSMMNSLPAEQVSVPSILHCIVEQVVTTEEGKSFSTLKDSSTEQQEELDVLKDKLGMIEHRDMDSSSAKENHHTPVVVTYGDHIAHNDCTVEARDEKEISLLSAKETEWSMISHSVFTKLLQKLEEMQPHAISKEREARLHQLLHFCKNSVHSDAHVDFVLQNFILESMSLAFANRNGCICPADSVPIAWDDPYTTPLQTDSISARAYSQQPASTGQNSRSEVEFWETLPPSSQNKDMQSGLNAGAETTASSSQSSQQEGTFSNAAVSDSDSQYESKSVSESTGAASKHQDRLSSIVDQDSRSSTLSAAKLSSMSDSYEQASTPSTMNVLTCASPTASQQIVSANASMTSILKKNTSQAGLRLTSSTVRFEDGLDVKRDLSEFCYVDLLEKRALLQVLSAARDRVSHCDAYWQRRDNSLLLALHSPHNKNLQSFADWSYKVHSDVGFRNYLECFAEDLTEWTAAEDEKYEARLAVEEEEVRKAKLVEVEGNSTPSALIPSEPTTVDASFVRAGSLKGLKLEQEKAKQEEEGRRSSGKHGTKASPARKGSKTKAAAKDDKKHTATRASVISITSNKAAEAPKVHAPAGTSDNEFPFYGYDLGNKFFCGGGTTRAAFPCDGSVIEVKTTSLQEHVPNTLLSVRKRDTALHLHNKESGARSFTARLADGMCLTFSLLNSEVTGALVDGTESAKLASPVMENQPDEDGPETPCLSSCFASQKALSLRLCCPTGMCVQYISITDAPGTSEVFTRLSYRTENDKTKCCRYILHDGTVVLFQPDGKLHVMHSDGSVSRCDVDSADGDASLRWDVTASDGTRYTTAAGTCEEGASEPIYSSVAVDPSSKEVLIVRHDEVVVVRRPDDSRTVQHCDGTRITTTFHPKNDGKLAREVKVESPGFATVCCFPDEHKLTTVFGNGDMITITQEGNYDVSATNGEHLLLAPSGELQYSAEENACRDTGSHYEFSLNGDTCFNMKDANGSIFKVFANGEVDVQPGKNAHLSTDQVPRYFFVRTDGNGGELLQEKDLSSYLAEARADPATAVIESALSKSPKITGLSILKPCLPIRWDRPYDVSDIVPKGLKSRDFSEPLRPTEVKRKVRFGADVGRGLSVGDAPSRAPATAPVAIPRILEIRNLLRYAPMTAELRDAMIAGLRRYQEERAERGGVSRARRTRDPRSDEERLRAADLLGVFRRAAAAPRDDERTLADYVATLTPPSTPAAAPPRLKLTAEHWERLWEEVACEQAHRLALRDRDVPPYFRSELGQAFLVAADDGAGSTDSGSVPGSMCSTPAPDRLPRPANPTPCHAAARDLATPLSPAKLRRSPSPRKHARPSPGGRLGRSPPPPLRSKLRGFQLVPSVVDFGTVGAGGRYARSVLLRNVGVEPSRFKVRQPAPSSGVVVRSTPGLVAAGMSTQLDVQLSTESDARGRVEEPVVIVTEVEELTLMVHACVALGMGGVVEEPAAQE